MDNTPDKEELPERLELTSEDFAEEEPAPPAASERLVLGAEDFSEEEVFEPAGASVGLPAEAWTKPEVAPCRSSALLRPALLMVAGLVGAVCAWLFGEIILLAWSSSFGGDLIIRTALYGLVAGALIGLFLSSFEELVFGDITSALAHAFMGGLIGACGGALGGALAEWAYQFASTGHLMGPAASLLVRAVGWSVLGFFLGIGSSALHTSAAKLRNGLLGGALGGLLGGIAFEAIKGAVASSSLGRLLALLALGACVGLLMGLAGEVFKQAWLAVVKGSMRGKQFILHKPENWVGSSPEADVRLVKEPGLAERHFVLRHTGTGWQVQAERGLQVGLDGQPVSSARLRDGALLYVGNTVLVFWVRQGKGKEGR